MKDTPQKFGIRAIGNVMIGQGTFIKAPGYKHSIETRANTQIGDGTFIDTSEEPASDKDSNTAKRDISVQAIGTIIGSAVLGAAGLIWSMLA